MARHRGDRLWGDPDAPRLGVPGGVARSAGVAPIQIVVVRDPEGKFRDAYLFTTDLGASLSWVVATFARRWSIEVMFKASKQVMGIESPQHWCRESIEKLAPWVWLMQSVVSLWYLTVGPRGAGGGVGAAESGAVGHGMVAGSLGARPPGCDHGRDN